jgi:Pin2-interacting protein X1
MGSFLVGIAFRNPHASVRWLLCIDSHSNRTKNTQREMDHHDHHLIPVGAKLRRQRGSMMRESASAPVSHFARAQLERMGWTEGTGLGKRQHGMTTHIKVKQRIEACGLGAEKMALVQQQKEAVEGVWWMEAVGQTLAKLGGCTDPSQRQRRHVTDEELFLATGGARFGMRAGKTRNLDKWKRVDDHHHHHHHATTKSASRPGQMEPGSDSAQKHGAPLDKADDAMNHDDPQQKTKKTKKRKARDCCADVEDVENVLVVLDEDEDQKKKKSSSRKRSKKDKKSKKEKKKEKKREKRG